MCRRLSERHLDKIKTMEGWRGVEGRRGQAWTGVGVWEG